MIWGDLKRLIGYLMLTIKTVPGFLNHVNPLIL